MLRVLLCCVALYPTPVYTDVVTGTAGDKNVLLRQDGSFIHGQVGDDTVLLHERNNLIVGQVGDDTVVIRKPYKPEPKKESPAEAELPSIYAGSPYKL
jgi:hypothetical protein